LILNLNQSNLLHILFAHFGQNPKHAPQLADLLIARNIDINHVDRDGKSPLHLALKKFQIDALKYCHEYNLKNRGKLGV
jgi:ankyrin repeat protein